MKNYFPQLIGLVTTGILTTVSSADVVHLVNGQKQVGVIVQQKTNSSQVTIRSVQGEVTLPRNRVARIETETPAVSWAKLGDEYSQIGNHEKALEAYKLSLEMDGSNEQIRAKVQQTETALQNKEASVQAATDSVVQRAIDQAANATAAKQYEQAYLTLKNVEPSEGSPLRPLYIRTLSNTLLQWGIERLDKMDTKNATEKFNELLLIDPDNQQAKQLLMKTLEDDPTKLEEIAAFYSKSENPADKIKGADALYKLRKYEEALPIYVAYVNDPNVSETDKQPVIEKLKIMLDILHQQAASKGDYAKALEYFGNLLYFKPDVDVLPYSKYSYMIKRGTTDMADPNSRAELAKYAEDLGLAETAREEYNNILLMDPKNEAANAAVQRMAEMELADAQEYYNTQQYTLAVQKAAEVARTYSKYEGVVARANALQAQAQAEQTKIQQNAKQQAIALAQRGDNYYNQGMSYLASLVSTDRNQNVTIFSPRNEAAKAFRQAIFAWQEALRLDPSLGSPTSYDLVNKIQDARAKYATVGNRLPPRMPSRDITRARN